jgi:uncharacterized phage protein (TIGR01671 family)
MREIKFKAWESGQKVVHPPFGLFMIPKWTEPLTNDNGVKVMQFTGLKDKGGRDIYEGDICRHRLYENEAYRIFEVEYVDGGFRYSGRSDNHWFTLNTGANFEVIGNIYENPELLK